jgi:hypothetical protein
MYRSEMIRFCGSCMSSPLSNVFYSIFPEFLLSLRFKIQASLHLQADYTNINRAYVNESEKRIIPMRKFKIQFNSIVEVLNDESFVNSKYDIISFIFLYEILRKWNMRFWIYVACVNMKTGVQNQ